MSATKYDTAISREELRVLILHEYRLGTTARATTTKINQTMGPNTVHYSTVTRWFNRFKDGNTNFEDELHTGRPTTIDIDALKAAVEEDPRQSSRCLAERLQCSHYTVLKHLHDLGKSWKFGAWIPHQLAPNQLQLRSDICMSLLTYKRTTKWLEDLVTGDEKWVLYVNYTRKRQWLSPSEPGVSTPKGELHPKKVLLCCWWNAKGVIHWELMPNNNTITAQSYCAQLDAVAEKLRGKQQKVYFLHDNARPHVASMTQQKIQSLGWTTLPHPPYSPDLAPTDYHLFRALSQHLEEKRFTNENDLNNDIQRFFDEKPPDFYKRGIDLLPVRWQYVVDNNGAYVID